MPISKAVILTGTSSGLGEALFSKLSGNMVIIALARRFTTEQQTAAKTDPCLFHLIKTDLSIKSSLDTALSGLDKIMWEIFDDIVFINNAATIEPLGKIGKLNNQNIDMAIRVNFTVPIILMNYIEAKRNNCNFTLKVINIASRARLLPTVGWSLYCSTKAGSFTFFENYRKQVNEHKKIEVYSFDPGLMNSPMQKKIRAASYNEIPDLDKFITYFEQKYLQNPEEVANRLITEYNLL